MFFYRPIENELQIYFQIAGNRTSMTVNLTLSLNLDKPINF